MAIKISFILIKVTFLKNLHVIDIKALYFLLLKNKVRIKSSIRIKKIPVIIELIVKNYSVYIFFFIESDIIDNVNK